MITVHSPVPLQAATRLSSRAPAGAHPGEHVELSVIIPAYEESERLERHLRILLPYLQRLGMSYEVIVVDDGSTDGTAERVETFAREWRTVRVVRLARNRGKGCAVRTGMLVASGAMRLFTDADGAIPISQLDRLMNAVRDGAEIAIGSKRPSTSGRIARRLASKVFNLLVRTLVLPGVRDSQCGFKLFSAATAESLFRAQTLDGFCFDVEVLFLARERGLSVAQLDVEWHEVGRGRIRLVRDALRMTRDLLRIRWSFLRGRYRTTSSPECG